MRDIRLVSRMLSSFWRLVAEPWRMLNRRNSSQSNCAKRSTPLVKLLVSWILKICWERSSANSASGSEGSTRIAENREPHTKGAKVTEVRKILIWMYLPDLCVRSCFQPGKVDVCREPIKLCEPCPFTNVSSSRYFSQWTRSVSIIWRLQLWKQCRDFHGCSIWSPVLAINDW